MKALIVDAGNSRVACAAWEGDGQLPVLSAKGGSELAPPVLLKELGDLDHPSGPGGDEAFLESFQRLVEKSGSPEVLVGKEPKVMDWLVLVNPKRSVSCCSNSELGVKRAEVLLKPST